MNMAASAAASSSPILQVLDLGQVVAGNFAGGLLAYFGADVIKVGARRGRAAFVLVLA